jgi:hypothetical protein
MNFTESHDLEEIKRTGPATDRERLLLEALSEAEALKDTLTGIFNDYPMHKGLDKELERIRKALEKSGDEDGAEAILTAQQLIDIAEKAWVEL